MQGKHLAAAERMGWVMTKVIFGLEQVLMYRKEMEKVCKMEFSSAQREFDGAVNA